MQEELFCLLRGSGSSGRGSAASPSRASSASSFAPWQPQSHSRGYQPPEAGGAAAAAAHRGDKGRSSTSIFSGLYQSSGLYGSNPLVLPPNPLASSVPLGSCGAGLSRTSSKQELLAAPAPASALDGGSVARAVATQPSVRRAALVCLPLMAVPHRPCTSNLPTLLPTAPHRPPCSPSQPFTALHSPRTPPPPPLVPPVQVQQLSGISNLFTFSAAVVRANGFDDDATAQVHALTLTLTTY